MERRDRVIVGVGAMVLALAVAIVGASPATSTLPWRIVHTVHPEVILGESLATSQAVTTLETSTRFLLPGPNLHHLELNVTASATPAFASAARLVALLTAPNGTTYEQVASSAAGSGSVRLTFSIPLAPVPPEEQVEAPDAEAAEALSLRTLSTVGAGEWTLDVAFQAPPVPTPSVQLAFDGTASAWRTAILPLPSPVGR